MTFESSTSMPHPSKRNARKHRLAGLSEVGAAKQAPAIHEVLASVGLWVIIIVVIRWYWTLSSVGSIVESVVGDRMSFSNGSIVETHIREKKSFVSCWSKPLPSVIVQKFDKAKPPELHRTRPTITLYAPCPTDAYVSIAEEAEDAHAFHYVQTSAIKKLVVQFHGEEPIIWRGDLEDRSKMLGFLFGACGPKVGMFTDAYATQLITGMDELRRESNVVPLVTFVPEPDLDGPAIDSRYRGLFMHVQNMYAGKAVFTYMMSGMHPEWLASEFGVTRYPSMVVQKEYPGRPHVFTGELTEESILSFMRDVFAGCTDYRPQRVFAPLVREEHLECDAGTVLK